MNVNNEYRAPYTPPQQPEPQEKEGYTYYRQVRNGGRVPHYHSEQVPAYKVTDEMLESGEITAYPPKTDDTDDDEWGCKIL